MPLKSISHYTIIMVDTIKVSFTYSETDIGGDIKVNLDGTTYYLPYIKIKALPNNIDGAVAILNAEQHHNNNQAAAWEVFDAARSVNWSLASLDHHHHLGDDFDFMTAAPHQIYYFNE